MPFVLKPSFNYEAFEQVIKSYKFPITDLETAVKFLNELPKECNVDLRESITYCNLHSVQAIDGKFNMLVLCNNFEQDNDLYKVYIMLRDIKVFEMDNRLFVVVRSGDDETASEIYLNNEILVLNPTTDSVYHTISKYEL